MRGRRIDNFLELWWLLASGVVGIWVSSTSFQKINIGWPQQPLTEIVLISVKFWIFDDSFLKKGPVLVILVPGMIQPSQSVMFQMKWGCKGHWGHGGCWGCGGHWGCRGSKVWKISTEDFSHPGSWIQLYFDVLEKKILVESWNIMMNFSTFLLEAVEASQCYFFVNWFMKLKCPNLLKSLGTRHPNSRKVLFLLPLRAI